VDVLAAGCLSLAILSLGLALRTTSLKEPGGRRPLVERLTAHHRQRLAEARIAGNPVTYVAMTFLAPVCLFALGWLQSPVLALFAGGTGVLVPRIYLAWLVHAQSRRSESEAPRLLQAVLSGLATGNTYLDALRQARLTCTDPWIQEDLDYVIQRFLLDVPLQESLQAVRARVMTRNLGLIWDTLRICAANQLPTQAARTLFFELSSTVQFNVQLANEVRARSSGQRAQIWLLAVIVPGMYVYLKLMSPQLLSVLDETTVGRYVLVPLAAALEVIGLALSFRIARFEA
jgi:Flp pilus assembly protein TadB